MTFRTRSFVSALATAAVTLTVAMTMMSWSVRRSVGDRIERSLINEARLARLLSTVAATAQAGA